MLMHTKIKKINNKLLHRVQFFIHFCIGYVESWIFHSNTADVFLSPLFKWNLGTAFSSETGFLYEKEDTLRRTILK